MQLDAASKEEFSEKARWASEEHSVAKAIFDKEQDMFNRLPSGYNLFMKKIAAEHPGEKVTETCIIAANAWNSMLGSEKEPFQSTAAAVRDERLRKRPAPEPKFTTNAFTAFVSRKYQEVKQSLPSQATYKEVSRVLASIWSSMSDESKQPYKEFCETEKGKRKAFLESKQV